MAQAVPRAAAAVARVPAVVALDPPEAEGEITAAKLLVRRATTPAIAVEADQVMDPAITVVPATMAAVAIPVRVRAPAHLLAIRHEAVPTTAVGRVRKDIPAVEARVAPMAPQEPAAIKVELNRDPAQLQVAGRAVVMLNLEAVMLIVDEADPLPIPGTTTETARVRQLMGKQNSAPLLMGESSLQRSAK